MTTSEFSIARLRQLQSLPLEAKVALSTNRIREWMNRYPSSYVSFSGGKDSTVLLHLVRSLYHATPAVFVDTGLEYPEIREFVKTIDDVTWLRPKLSFRQVIERYGWPVASKEVAQKVSEAINTKSDKLRDIRLHGGRNGNGKLPEKWKFLIDAPFSVSHKCCEWMKKKPVKEYERVTSSCPIVGTMASESRLRETAYIRNGCNSFDSSRPMSRPLSVWTDEDVWGYIRSRGLDYARIYDTGVKRTGCIFCAFGAHLEPEPNRFQRLRVSHPKLWSYCMDKLGLREVLEYIGVKTGDDVEKGQLNLGIGE